MRSVVLAILMLTTATAATAQGRFSLGLEDLPIGTPAAISEIGISDDLELEVSDDSREALVYRSALTPTSPKEFTLALWNAPMGRLYYSRAEAEAMLGREGLVHGGRMVGLGMAPTSLGDGSQSSLSLLASGRSWSELTLGEKFAAGAEASFVAAILYALASAAD
jgi:hypothetical protein